MCASGGRVPPAQHRPQPAGGFDLLALPAGDVPASRSQAGLLGGGALGYSLEDPVAQSGLLGQDVQPEGPVRSLVQR